jgi:hypothetical protein
MTAIKYQLNAVKSEVASVTWSNLALMYLRIGAVPAAIDSLTRAAAISPDMRYLQKLVSLLVAADRIEEGVAWAYAAVRLHEYHPHAHFVRLVALLAHLQLSPPALVGVYRDTIDTDLQVAARSEDLAGPIPYARGCWEALLRGEACRKWEALMEIYLSGQLKG